MRPYAARYGGHQFGQWADQLGDGRAITLGEVTAPDGQSWELQLKGAGRTPYSRQADGRAVLRSSVREFLCSEAMHFLGIPTTRALSLVTTGEPVVRDMFYDGRPDAEPGAIVCRVAPSFVRFGSFEIHATHGETDILRRLADYVIATHYPELGAPSSATYLALFEEVCRRTAILAAHWTRVGFVHGVLNTDNMSILGLTIDYGPYGWLEGYDPTWTPNTTDAGTRRYRYGQQPNVALWNLARLGEALSPLIETPDELHRGLEIYRDTFDTSYSAMLRDKLGLDSIDTTGEDPILVGVFGLLEAAETDMTIFFRGLAHVPVEDPAADDEAWLAPIRDAFYDAAALEGPHRLRVLDWLRDICDTRPRRRPGAGCARRSHAAREPEVRAPQLSRPAGDRRRRHRRLVGDRAAVARPGAPLRRPAWRGRPGAAPPRMGTQPRRLQHAQLQFVGRRPWVMSHWSLVIGQVWS